MKSYPLISIVTSAYNASSYLRDLATSVKKQTYTNYEHLIIDDGSQDDGHTAEILRALDGTQWYSRENRGQYPSQNELLEQARGTYVNVICADDYFANPRLFQDVADCAEAYQPDVIFGDTELLVATDSNLTYCPYLRGRSAWDLTPALLMVQHCSVFVRREFLIANSLFFSTAYKIRGDWEWLIRMWRAATTVQYVGGTAAFWRCHPTQTSLNTTVAASETQQMLTNVGLSHKVHTVARRIWAPYARFSKARAITRRDGVGGLCAAGSKWVRRDVGGVKTAS